MHLPLLLRLVRRLEFPHKLGICERLFASSLAKNGIVWIKTAAGPIWKLDLANSTHRWIVYGQYEGPAFWTWAKRNLSPDPVIVDSGANIGQTTLYFASYFPTARILAFEPGLYQADWFRECIARNPDIQAKLFQHALGASEQTMYLQPSGHSCAHGGQNIVTAEVTGEPIQVVKLADVLDAEKISRVDLWKLDVEGFEIQALQGASDWLESKKIGALWIETIGENGRRVVSFMRDIGYQSFALRRDGRPVPVSEHREDNTLFLPR